MKNWVILLLSPILILTSCLYSGCPVIEISKEDKDWLRPFQKYRELTFKNQNDQTHVFRVQEIDSMCTPCNKFEIGPYQYQEIFTGYSSNKVLNSPSGRHQSIALNISASEQDDSKSKKFLYVYDFSLAFYKIDSNFIVDSIYTPAFNKKMTAYYFDKGNKYNTNQTGLNIKSIHYNKDFGLLQYVSEKDTFKLTKIK